MQRWRMLSAVVAVLSEEGYERMSVARIAASAGVSRRTFYELFEDREDCFLEAFDALVTQLGDLLRLAYERERGWRGKVRGALAALLEFLDAEPGASALLVLEALKAGPRVLRRRGEVLREVSALLHDGGTQSRSGQGLPPLIAEGVVGAVVGVVHTHLTQPEAGPLSDLLDPLMSVIVLPYRGRAVAQRELAGVPSHERSGEAHIPTARLPLRTTSMPVRDPLAGLSMRITHRTLMVLTAIAEQPGASNRRIGERAGVSDPGQISRLLTRLEGLGLILNTGHGQSSGEPNAWRLTPRGKELQRAIEPQLQANNTAGAR